jgi:hypothetical protein
MNHFCYHCRRYDDPCNILGLSLSRTLNDADYPPQWLEEDISLDDYPTLRAYLLALNERCTAFEPGTEEELP